MTRRFGTVRKRPSGRFQAIYEHHIANGRQVSRTFDTRKAAEDWLADERTKLTRGEWLDPASGRVTVDEFFGVWIDGRPLAPRTVELYRWLWGRCVSADLGCRQLGQLTPTLIRSWHARLVKAERPGPTTVAKAYRLLSAVLADAARDGAVGRNPCIIVGAGVEPRRKIRVLSVPEVEQLADEMPNHLRVLVLVAAYGGLRWGEVAGLPVWAVDRERCSVTVSQTLSEHVNGELSITAPKTAAGYRTIVLPASVALELDQHIERYADELVFTTVTGCQLRRPNFTQEWKRAVGRAGLSPLRFHDLRHTAGTLATRNGATVREVQARLGHASPLAALRYQHLVSSAESELAARLDERRAAG